MEALYDIKFTGTEELLKLAQEDARLLAENCATAVTNTTLYGIARIANDCSVDTGRLQASIAGDLAKAAGVDLLSGHIREGKAQSTTHINLANLEAVIGTNVEYALYVEYRDQLKRKPLTDKQRRYLFAIGVLKRAKDGKVTLKLKRRKKPGGPGFFRKNIPLIERFFNSQMDAAIKATALGQSLRDGRR